MPPFVLAALWLAIGQSAAPDSAASTPAPAGVPHWIWAGEAPGDGEAVLVRRRFELDELPASARVRATADDLLELSLGDELLFVHGDWTAAAELEIADRLRVGSNELVAWCRNDAGPAAFRCALELAFADGSRRVVTSGPDWEAALAAQEPDWRPAHDFGPLGVDPWGEPGPTEPAETGGTAPPEAIEVPPGFTVERAYEVPGRQGSWVSLTFDDRGRALASDESGALYRFDPESGRRAERLDVDLGSAQGLTYAFDALYVVVNSFGTWTSGLYRLRDTTGDDRFDDVRLLRAFDGRGEHGPHAVVPGPDGRSLWVLCGNHTALPEPLDASRVPRVWDEDQLLPREPDPGGHAVGVLAPGGWVARTDPDGERWELWAIGMRNAYDLAFDQRGAAFTFDSDMEWDVGLPWYRPARVLELASGADFGWRHGSGKWPTYVPDSLPGILDVGLASPTGVLRSDELAFPAAWRARLFVADWAYGTIYAVALAPDGAAYAAERLPFVRARGLPVTDLAVGPAGGLWFAVGGRGTRSALYVVRWSGGDDGAPRSDPAWVERAVRVRRDLEALHGARDGETRVGSLASIWDALDDPDRFVRHAARVALEGVEPARWRERALAEPRPRAAALALTALARVAPESAPAVRDAALDRIARGGPTLGLLRALELAWIRGGLEPEPGDARALRAHFPTGRHPLDGELAKLLVRAGALAPDALLERLDAARTQEETLAYAWLLRSVDAGWTAATRADFAAFLDRARREFEGGASLAEYLNVIREAAGLPVGEDVQVTEAAFPVASEPARARTFQNAWRTADLVGHLPALNARRSFERGERVFREARCLDCHRIDGRGGADGPDLTGAGGRFGARDLLDALVEPSRAVSDQYRHTELWLADGTLVVGRLVGRDGPWLTIQEAGSTRPVEVHVDDVELERPHPLSPMPDGLLDTFTREEILDLCAYVLAGADESAPAFADDPR